MDLDPMSEVEERVVKTPHTGQNRFCATRRRSMSCSRLAPTPQFDLCQLERLSKNREVTPTCIGTIKQSGSPTTDSSIVQTSSGSSPSSFSSMGKGSVLRRPSTLMSATSERRSGRKGLSWLHPKTWMRKKRQHGGGATPPGFLISSSNLHAMDASAFGTEQVMKPTEAFQ